jgi:anti-sigma factor RsiW
VDCRDAVELVTAYLEGELDLDRFVAHLAGCAGCRRYLDQIRRTIDALGSLPPDRLDGPVRDRLLAVFRDRPGS